MADPSPQTVQIELQGARTQGGIELDSLEKFIDKFRDALRDFERSASGRGDPVGRGGHPDARSIAATRFKIASYRLGSAIFELVEPISTDIAATLPFDTEGPATRNLTAFLDSIESGELDPMVVDKLDEARRALGDHGRISVRVPRRQTCCVDDKTIKRLRSAHRPPAKPEPVMVYGRLHLIASEGNRVEIRATDHYNWHCSYDDELEDRVLPLITKRVWARGLGARERANRGSLVIEDLGVLPEYERTPLFSDEPVPLNDLLDEQGITGPQGLAAVGISDMSNDEVDRFLAVMLE